MNREQAKENIKSAISCSTYLQPAPNHSGNNGYCCPYCHSGEHSSRSTGAVKYYPDSNTFYCHACGRGGDVIDLYRAQTGSDYNEALNTLAAEINITIDAETQTQGRQIDAQDDFNDENDPQDKEKEKDAENAKQSPADYSAYYSICRDRLNDPAALAYLQARGISEATAAACGVGFDPAADPANAPGAIRNEYKPHPAPRIIAPCTAGFYIARSTDPQTPAAYKAPNPKGSSTQLFNAAALLNDPGAVFVCEGIFDALSFEEAGAAAIATNGKGNGNLLLQHLQEHPARSGFIICHDNENDPQEAADTLKRARDLNAALQRAGYKSIVYNVAGLYHDANDEIKDDPAAFKEAINAALQALEHEKNRDELTDFYDKIQTDAYKPHTTGLNFIDNLLYGGIISQTLILLMASPGAGKTTLCQQLGETLAEHKTPVIYFNFEMSIEQMLAKAISSKYYRGNGGDLGMLEILQGYNWSDDDRAGIKKTLDEYRRDNYPFIKYNPGGVSANLDELLTYLDEQGQRAAAAGEQAPAAVIDYLHLLTTTEKLETDELIKRAVTGLKNYAMRYHTFVIAIVAANREGTKSGRLTLESGRDSSNLELGADVFLSLNYTEIDAGKVKTDNIEEVERLKLQNPRKMTIRTLKTRGIPARPAVRVLYDPKHNIFYGTCEEFTDAPDAPAFEEAQQVTARL